MPKDNPVSTQTLPGNSSVSSKKRKRFSDTTDQSHPTIQDLLSTTHQKPSVQTVVQTKSKSDSSPKRPRVRAANRVALSPLPADKMYSFPKAKQTTEVIDLTKSPSPLTTRKLAMASIVGPQIGAKRLVVKNQRPSKSNTKAYYDEISTKLDRALDLILREGDSATLSMEELYQGVKNVCKQGHATDLCRRLTTTIKNHAENSVKPRILNTIGPNPTSDSSLDYILGQWTLWRRQWATIRSIYYYMDTPPLVSLSDTEVELFLQDIMGDEIIKDAARIATCNLISQDRNGLDFNIALCQGAIQMFTELGLYSDDLEPFLLSESQSYASKWAIGKSVEEDLRGYVRSIKDLFDSEMKRCDLIGLNSHTKTGLLALLEKATIEQCENRLVNERDVGELLDEDAEDDLAVLYVLLCRCKLSNKLIKPFESWIRKTGIEVVFDEKQEDDMVVRLLALYQQIDRIHIDSFQRNKDFAYALRDTFEEIMNKTKKTAATHNTDNTKQGEMIAKYVDLLLRGGHKAIPTSVSKATMVQGAAEDEDNEVEDQDAIMNDQLDQVLDLFRFLHGKAVFEAFYKKDLARRLLMGRSASADAELSMLTRLKNECGDGFTHNLETMFKDIELSKEEMLEHKQRMEGSDNNSKLDLSVMILSKAAWPSYPDIKVNVPQHVQHALRVFETSYKAHHGGRILEWKHGLAHCVVSAQFSKKKELVVSGFQAIVLLLFNKEDTLSYERILAETGLRKYLVF
jgi:cullin 4